MPMTITAHDTSTARLSDAMRSGSRAAHEAAEGSPFVARLLAGQVSAAGYAAYLLRLRVVYGALESTVRARADDPLVAAVHDEALTRRGAIEADLEHWCPSGTPDDHSPAAAAYAERIRGATWGGTLVAHHYTRYLGDLAGGRAIGRVLDRTFALDGAGLRFYAFTAIARPKPYRDAYRARLDALDLAERDVERVVEEVRVAFALNRALFAELDRRHP